jgi:hypothetical protein
MGREGEDWGRDWVRRGRTSLGRGAKDFSPGEGKSVNGVRVGMRR